MKIKIDDKTVRSLPFTTTGQKFYFDTKFAGFGVCVGKTKRSFFLQKTKNYKPVRVILGSFPEINSTLAREKALSVASEIQNNVDFNVERKGKRSLNQMTLQDLYDQFKMSLEAKQKTSSLSEYPKILERHFMDWLPKPITNLTKTEVVERHRYISKSAGLSIANKSFRLLRAMYNFGKTINEQVSNPVDVLTERQLWNTETSKTNRIKPNDLNSWMTYLLMIPNPVMKLYLVFILLHGLRKSEASNLQWQDIDFKNQCFTITKTKNKRPLTLPITAHAAVLLDHLKCYRRNEYVFPSTSDKSDRLTSPKKSMDLLNKYSGTDVTPHDLRRTFASIANTEKVSPYTLKKIINHSVRNDVTAIYTVDETEDLLVPLQSIQSKILDHAQIQLSDLR